MKTGPNEPDYDKWKTRIPLSYEYADEEELSNCCGAPRLDMETDICSNCKEHCDFEEEG